MYISLEMYFSGYEHGREWLAKKVSGLITGNGQDDKNKLQVEKELLEVIDELYRSVVVVVVVVVDIFIDELHRFAKIEICKPVIVVVASSSSRRCRFHNRLCLWLT